MEQPIMPVGVENFEKLRRLGGYYIDKTTMLSKLLKTPPFKPVVFTRPHNFGKTLALSMMESFFDIRKDSKKLFEGLVITEQQELCAEWMNQYPTIFFSFQNIKCHNFVSAYGMLELEISRLCQNYLFLKDSEKNDPSTIRQFIKLLHMEASMSEVKGALSLLMKMLYRHYEKPVILLLDAYDTPIACAEKQDYHKDMMDVMNGIFGTAMREEEALKLAIISGCLSYANEGLFLGEGDCHIYSVMEESFCDSFGFTKSEVDQIFSDAGMKDQSELIKKWYGGYVIGQSELYCPWDVMHYVSKVQEDKTITPDKLSNHTSFYPFQELFTLDRQDKLETLLHDKTISEPVLSELGCDFVEDDIWSRLLMEGYLSRADSATGRILSLKIPNKKIKNKWEDAIVCQIKNTMNTNDPNSYRVLMDALWESDTTTASKLISNLLFQTICCDDCHEDFYCIFLSEILKGTDGTIDFNIGKESAKPDIIIRDRKNRSAIIIEAKKAENIHSLNKACDEGIVQIITRQYDKGLGDGFQTVLSYSISFYQKTCMVKKLVIEE